MKEKIFDDMPERSGIFAREEMDYIRCDPHDVLEAKTRIVRQMNMMFEYLE